MSISLRLYIKTGQHITKNPGLGYSLHKLGGLHISDAESSEPYIDYSAAEPPLADKLPADLKDLTVRISLIEK
ncbi:MAG: hypothetical protein WCW14_00870, partial [Candidatus Paceibacterota bacterium]